MGRQCNHTISLILDKLKNLNSNLEGGLGSATDWFRKNAVIVNPSQFQSIIIHHGKTNHHPQLFNIDRKETKSPNNMALLRLETDSRLNFEKHISAICHNVTGQLNALGCVWSFLDNDKKIAITNTSIYRNVNYCPLIWHICSNNSISKIENIPKRTLQFFLMTLSQIMKHC